MNIAFDIDGTLTTGKIFDKIYLRLCSEEGIPPNRMDCTKYNFAERYCCSSAMVDKLRSRFLSLHNTDMIRPGVKNLIKQLKTDDNRIFIITSRGLNALEKRKQTFFEETVQWLHTQGVSFDKLYWGVEQKWTLCKKLGIDVIVEDAPYQLQNLCGVCTTVKVQHAYNTQIPADFCIKDMAEIIAIMNKLKH